MAPRFAAYLDGSRSSNGRPDRSYDAQEVARLIGTDIIYVTTETATVDESWRGRMVAFTAGCTVTIPAGLEMGFSCGWSQEGADALVFVAGEGATVQSRESLLTSGGQYSMGGIAWWQADVLRLYGQLTEAE